MNLLVGVVLLANVRNTFISLITVSSLLLTLQEGVAVEIAEAVVGALRGDLSATAVNAPMVPPEVKKLLTQWCSG